MLIACDVDDVCANLVPEWVRLYNLDYEDDLKIEQINDWNISSFVKPQCGMKIYDYIEVPTLYDNVIPVDGALKTINKLKKQGHRVIYVTSSTVGHNGVKYRWLKKYGFIDNRKDYVEAADKSLIYSDILIDDNLDNVINFKGLGILFRRYWNINSNYYTWMADWNDMTYLNESYLRKEFSFV